MVLTELQAKQANPPWRDWKISDGGCLYVLIRPDGSKLWRMKYLKSCRPALAAGPRHS